MRFLSDVSLNVRLYVGYGLVLLLMVLLVIIGASDVRDINAKLTQINDVNSVKQRYAINFRGSVHDRAISARDMVLLSDPVLLDEARAEIAKLTEDYLVSAKAMDALFQSQPDLVDADERRILASIKEIEAQTFPLIDSILNDVNQGNIEQANATLLDQARPNFVTWLARINEFIDLEEAKNKELTGVTRSIASKFQVQMVVVTAVAALIAILVALWMILAVKPLTSLTQNILALKDGDLDIEIPRIESQNEVGQIAGALTVFRDNAREAKALQERTAANEARQRQEEEERKERELREREEKQAQELKDREERQARELKEREETQARELKEREEKQAREIQAREEQRVREIREREEQQDREKREQETRQRAEEEAQERRREEMLALADEFEASVMGLVEDLARSADNMMVSARDMSSSIEDTIGNASNVSDASRSANANAHQVANAAKELSIRSRSHHTNAPIVRGCTGRSRSNRTSECGHRRARGRRATNRRRHKID